MARVLTHPGCFTSNLLYLSCLSSLIGQHPPLATLTTCHLHRHRPKPLVPSPSIPLLDSLTVLSPLPESHTVNLASQWHAPSFVKAEPYLLSAARVHVLPEAGVRKPDRVAICSRHRPAAEPIVILLPVRNPSTDHPRPLPSLVEIIEALATSCIPHTRFATTT